MCIRDRYITAPYHLEVTSHAFIGILIYAPVYGTFTSPLNSIYCAPNKLYEFSHFGIPMIGNNIPGLKYTIESYKMGCCLPFFNAESLKNAITDLTDNYETYAENARRFYDEDDKTSVIRLALTQKKEFDI